MFLPGQKLTAAELKLQLEKLKFEYTKRKLAIKAWADERAADDKASEFDSKNLEVLKKRTKQRLENGKDKTDTYRKAVKELLKDYKERYTNRQLNKFQWDQIMEWAKGKLLLSKERYNAFKDTIIGRYKAVVDQTKLAKESKRKQKVQVSRLAKEQQKKNLDAYDLAKKRLLLQGRVSGTSAWNSRAGGAFTLPTLSALGGGEPLDPIGGLDPFGDLDGGADDDLDF